jgi:NarL family two-component system response regulator LiaR
MNEVDPTDRVPDFPISRADSAKPLIRIVITDDHALFRDGLSSSLEQWADLRVVGNAASGEEALRMVEQLHPDIVLMDLLMPGMGGFAAIEALHERFPEVHLLVLTGFEEGDLVQQALKAGAVGYLLKDADIDEIAKAIRLVYRGMPTLAPAAAQTLVHEIAGRPPVLGYDLTEREREVLTLLAAGLSNQQIAEHLRITSATVKFYSRRIHSKLGTRSRTEAVVVAMRHQVIPAPS